MKSLVEELVDLVGGNKQKTGHRKYKTGESPNRVSVSASLSKNKKLIHQTQATPEQIIPLNDGFEDF
jgi:hypothetical protein